MWKIISGSAQDLQVDKHALKICTASLFAAEYGYSFDELRSAKTAQIDLDSHKAEAAKRTHSEKEAELAWFGDETHNIKGFIAPDNAIGITLPADGGSNNDKASILAKINTLTLSSGILTPLQTCRHPQQRKCIPDTLLPIAELRAISTKRDNITKKTILDSFLEANKHIKTVEHVSGLDNVDGKDLPVLPQTPQQRPAPCNHGLFPARTGKRGLELAVSCEAKMAGVELRRPLSCAYAKITPPAPYQLLRGCFL